MERGGFVLAGGQSIRMGRDKALLRVGDSSLIEYIARQVSAAVGWVAIIGSPDHYAGLGIRVYADDQPGNGPISGLETALSLGVSEWNLVVACDMPRLRAATLRRMFDYVPTQTRRAACVSALGPAGPEPLCAIYHSSCLPEVRRAIARKQFQLKALLERLETVPVEVEAEALANANTPAEWAEIERGFSKADSTL